MSSTQFIAAAILVLVPIAQQTAAACMCGQSPPCAAVWQADAVFIGTVVDRLSERAGGNINWTVHKIAVHQRLRGSVESSITLVPSTRPSADEIAASVSRPGESTRISSCEISLLIGRQYVIYAHRTAEGDWIASKCSGTKPIEEATADLDYIAGLALARPTGRVYGEIKRTILNAKDRTTTLSVPAAVVPVTLTGASGRVTVTTDAEGKLDVDVAPGVYTIAPVVPQSVRVYGSRDPVSVPARGCAPIYFSLISNGRIEGRVVRDDGSGVPRTYVDVIPADLPDDRRPDNATTSPSAMTDKNGRFAVDAILPGRYVVAVNARYGPRLDSPYPTSYFPRATRKDAREIDIGDGERVTGVTIVVTPLIETTVSGIVTSDDDWPVADANVSATPVDRGSVNSSFTKTDSSGAFQLRVLTGLTYVIRATLPTADGFRETRTVLLVDGEKEGIRLSIR